MKGTIVIEGYCTAEVMRVGDATECGKVFEAAQVNEGEPTPLSDKLNRLATLITQTSYAIAALVIVGRIVVYFISGKGDFSDADGWIDFISFFLQTVMIAVTLIVVAVPEGLPMSVTLSLAFSMRKLMKENTLPRTMHSCETMGAASVICTDKTGTLTQNQMQVAETMLTEENSDLVAEMIAANTTANLDFSGEKINAIGNPTEGALLLWLHAQGKDYQAVREATEILDRLPFTTENKYMATLVRSRVLGTEVVLVKGAPEIVMAMSKLSDSEREEFDRQLKIYQNKAMRTLAIAYIEAGSQSPFKDGKLKVTGLKFAGVFAISDPVRSEVPAAIKSCISAGIQVKIVTGDTPGTAKEIGRQIGLWTEQDGDENILTGAEFDAMSDEELAERIGKMKIMSRARPNDKERLVKLLKRQNMVVAVTGDGTNDAPALNAADVGLSMGDGTAVAKEASDMTIQDSSFSTITNAVMWGRSLYKNIQRFIMYQMTINVVACLIVLIGAFIGMESPLTVTQMLWVNLIMDTFAAIALASLPPTRSVMEEQPRHVTDSIISRAMARHVIGVGGFFTLLLLVVLVIMEHADIRSMDDLFSFTFGAYDGLSAYELSLFFTLFVMLQFWNMFNAKAFMTDNSAFHRLKECRGFMVIAFVIFVGQLLIVELGGQMFNVTPLAASDWGFIILATSPVAIVGEIYRGIKRGGK
jgi:Ca2+-transporting ATPase